MGILDEINTTKNEIKVELSKWRDMFNRNAPLQERLGLVDVESYLKSALKLVHKHQTHHTILPPIKDALQTIKYRKQTDSRIYSLFLY
ncbi:MAG: hypothetical protein ACFFAE_07280 [Candidatus Hodarchaeota archaeon]